MDKARGALTIGSLQNHLVLKVIYENVEIPAVRDRRRTREPLSTAGSLVSAGYGLVSGFVGAVTVLVALHYL